MRVNRRGRLDPIGRTAGEGDIVLIREAATYSPGSMIEVDGIPHEVARDLVDEVAAIVPESSRPLRGGGARPRGERNSAWATGF